MSPPPRHKAIIGRSTLPQEVRQSSVKPKSAPKKRESDTPLHLYSPQIARQLNPKQPDITAAVIHYNLSLWQNNRYWQTQKDRRRWSFRSLTDLERDHPYFSRECIHKALGRLERKLGDEFKVRRDEKVRHYSIGDHIIDDLKRPKGRQRKGEVHHKLISFYVEDAKATGDVRCAVLLQNLKHALKHFTNPKRDAEGNPYAEMSPKKLSAILNFSEDTISRALNSMCDAGHIKRHPDDRTFYALPDGFKTPAAANITPTADLHSIPAEVHTNAAEIHPKPAEVHSEPHENALEPLKTGASSVVPDATSINECITEDITECIKERDTDARATPRIRASLTSNGLKFLQDLADVSLAKMRSSKGTVGSHSWILEPELQHEHYEDIYELPYDIVSPEHRTNNARVKDDVRCMVTCFRSYNFPVDKEDMQKLHRFFMDNPQIDWTDLHTVLATIIDGELTWTNEGEWLKNSSHIVTKTRTAKAFLKYLPQILTLLFSDYDPDSYFGLDWRFDMDEPYCSLDFSYLGKVPQSNLFDFGPEDPTRY